MTLLWLLSLALKNSSIVDIFWGTGFVITAWAAFLLTPDGFLGRKLLLCCAGHDLGAAPVAAHPAPQLGQARRFPLPGLAQRSRSRLVVAQLLQGLPAAGRAAVDHRDAADLARSSAPSPTT